jgi:hypothetical protein
MGVFDHHAKFGQNRCESVEMYKEWINRFTLLYTYKRFVAFDGCNKWYITHNNILYKEVNMKNCLYQWYRMLVWEVHVEITWKTTNFLRVIYNTADI